MRVETWGKIARVSGITDFRLDEILDCGQCFRWEQGADGGWTGVVGTSWATVYQKEDAVEFHCSAPGDFEALWRNYFDLDTDYGAIKRALSDDGVMQKAAGFAAGMRILRQDAWEALCSFIISQNNNIPRIKGIVSRLCEQFGEPLACGLPAFPRPETLAPLAIQDLAGLRSGFRAKYILSAAQLVSSGTLDLDRVRALPMDEARKALMQIHGVGPKVAECALLYGMYRMEAFPEDVWIKRAVRALYPAGVPEVVFTYAGIAQQYLFHYIRCCPEALPAQAR